MPAPLSKLLGCLRLSTRRTPASKAVDSSSSSTEFDEKHHQPSRTQTDTLKLPETQQALLLHGIRQPYQLHSDQTVPKVRRDAPHELLVRTSVIGINPIDWKAPDYNFGVPELPRQENALPGDHVLAIATDYRDLRKAAYQQFPIANAHNVARIPPSLSGEAAASIGVAFVAAALSLGICTGLDFSSVCDGPDLLKLVRDAGPALLPEDIREECLTGIDLKDRLSKGDWVAVWGGSSTSAYMIYQLARLVGVKTISVLDVRKHSDWIYGDDSEFQKADVVVDSHDPARAVEIVRAVGASDPSGRLRFGIDTVGKTTAAELLKCMTPAPTEPAGEQQSSSLATTTSTSSSEARSTHLVGLTGLPKRDSTNDTTTKFHTVPIKLFHEVPEVGEALMAWLERLLAEGLLKSPRILAVEEGLESVNGVLDRMRKGEISGGRAVVRV
ncbi:uncharacterized protein AB675_5988 [Cyphellophora attinorum]|uniref:Uncharacterized protein n=1 Tax=Cyphellophora attinorum TaxID=1664694 RepID=A0A0N1GZV6_9EURO|nr:uncharacterized protein AB675_5988 [Phialophora attinorum]KPI36893.1 hypothetical protein AB675_5988 [Phialophora attinorum]